jgi:hypothetical protein
VKLEKTKVYTPNIIGIKRRYDISHFIKHATMEAIHKTAEEYVFVELMKDKQMSNIVPGLK